MILIQKVCVDMTVDVSDDTSMAFLVVCQDLHQLAFVMDRFTETV